VGKHNTSVILVVTCGSGKMNQRNKSQGSVFSITLNEKLIGLFQYLLIIVSIGLLGFVIMNIDLCDPMVFFRSRVFRAVALSYSFIFIFWQVLNNKISLVSIHRKTSLKNIENTRNKKVRQSRKKTSRTLMILIGYTFSVAFTVMVMIFLLVAHLSGTGITRVVWNHFGEMMIETILFVIAFVFVVLGYGFAFKDFRKNIKSKKSIFADYDSKIG
jgi:hypothetical protein